MGRTCLAVCVLAVLPWIAAIAGEGGDSGKATGGGRAEELRKEIEKLKRELEATRGSQGKPLERAEKLEGEIRNLKKRIEEREKIRKLEKERDELRKELGESGEDPGSTGRSRPGAKFEVERVGLAAGLGVLAVDLNLDGGHVDNLGEARRAEADSYVRPGVDLTWVHLPGIIAVGRAKQYLFSDNQDEDYSQVDLQTWFWGAGYRLHHVSDSSDFLGDRIGMTRHGIALDPRLPLAAAEMGALGLFVPSVEADFVSSGDLEYDSMTVKIGSVGYGRARVNGVDVRTCEGRQEYGSRVNFTFGFTRRWYETRGVGDEIGLVGDLTFNHKARGWEFELGAASRYEDELFEMAGHKRVTDLDLDLKYVLHPRLRLTGGVAAGVEYFDAGEEAYGRDRRDLFARARGGMEFKVLPHGVLHLEYVPEVRESNIPEFDATVNRVEFGLRLTF